MRPTSLGHGVYKDDIDYGVFCGGWCTGRIYEQRTGPKELRCSGRCMHPADEKPCARQIGQRRLKWSRRNFRRAGMPGRRGRSWRRLPE
jgi:hypothetical protein